MPLILTTPFNQPLTLPVTDPTLHIAGNLLSGAAYTDGDDLVNEPNLGSLGGNWSVGANKPTYETNELNGLPVIRFGASAISSQLDLSTAHIMGDSVGTTGTTIFAVMNHDKVSDSTTGLFGFGATSNGVAGLASFTGQLYFDHGNTGVGRIQVAEPIGWGNAWHIVEFWRDSDLRTIRVDDVTLQTGSNSVQPNNTIMYTPRLGIHNNGTTYFVGDIAEYIVYNRALTTNEKNSVRNYLNTKYGNVF